MPDAIPVVMAAVVIFALAMIPIAYVMHDPPPTAEDWWTAAATAYPNGSTDCHVAVVDRILRMSVALLDSPHVAAGNPSSSRDERRAGMMAANMTLGGEWRAPECGDAEPQPWRTEEGESDRKPGWRGDRGGVRVDHGPMAGRDASLSYGRMWAAVVDAHPDASMECQMDLVERTRHAAEVLYYSPYATEGPGSPRSWERAEALAIGMVIDGEWRAPKCG